MCVLVVTPPPRAPLPPLLADTDVGPPECEPASPIWKFCPGLFLCEPYQSYITWLGHKLTHQSHYLNILIPGPLARPAMESEGRETYLRRSSFTALKNYVYRTVLKEGGRLERKREREWGREGGRERGGGEGACSRRATDIDRKEPSRYSMSCRDHKPLSISLYIYIFTFIFRTRRGIEKFRERSWIRTPRSMFGEIFRGRGWEKIAGLPVSLPSVDLTH